MGLRPSAICRRSARVGGGGTDERVGINDGDRCSLLVRNSYDGDERLPMSDNGPSDDVVPPPKGVHRHHGSPVVAFVIGLAIILLASILNAAGLNLTKLDHVRDPLYTCVQP